MIAAVLIAEYSPELAFAFPLFWLGIGLIVAGALLLGLLAPESPAPGPTQVTERANYLPLVIGKHRVGSAIMWRGNRETVNINIDQIGTSRVAAQGAAKGGGDDDVDGVLEEGMVGLCIGCVDVIQQLYLNGKPSLSGPISEEYGQFNGQEINYNAPDGNPDGTNIRPYFGSLAGYDVLQPSYQGLISGMNLDTERVPVFPNLCFIHFDKCYLGTQQPRWPRIEADVIVLPQEEDDLDFQLNHPELKLGIGGVNPAYCLYVLLTGEAPYGVGIDKDLIDKTSLNLLGQQLASEEIWININTGNGRTVEELVGEILSDCGIDMTEVQGVLTFSTRRRGDTAVNVDEDQLSPPVEKIEILTLKFNPTCVEFKFNDSGVNFKQNSVVVENDGPDVATGTKKNRVQTLNNVTTLDVAQQIANRRGQEFLSLQEAVELSLSRDAREIRPGENINIPDYGSLRVSKVVYDYNSPNVKVTGYKDPWQIVGIDGEDDGSGPVDPRPGCVRPTNENVFLGKTAPTEIRVCDGDVDDPDIGDGSDEKIIYGTCCVENKQGVVECSIKSSGECENLGGSFTAGAVCADIECVQPVLGTCCGEHEPGTESCEDNFTQNLCDNVLNGQFGGGSTCDNIECGVVSIRGVCCNPVNTAQPCYVIYDDGSECANGYVLDTSTDTCVGHCCDVADEVNQGSCCQCPLCCDGPQEPICENTTEAACTALGGTFTPGVPCCDTACTPCTNPPGPGDDIDDDLFVRPIIIPRLMEPDTGIQKSRLALLRSRASSNYTSMRGYAKDTPGSFNSNDLVQAFGNTPSIPAGTCIDTTGFSIQLSIPHSLRYIFEGPSIQLFDNQHFQDLQNTAGVRTKESNKYFFNSGQTFLSNENVSVFSVRDYAALDVNARTAQAKGLIPQRYGTEPVVDRYSNSVGDIDEYAIPASEDDNPFRDICVPRKQISGLPLLQAATVSSIDVGEQPRFKSQPGVGNNYRELSKCATRTLNDERVGNYFNKLNKGHRIGWCSAGNTVSSSYRRTVLGGGGTTPQLQPDVSTRGIWHTQATRNGNVPDASDLADLTVEACLPSTVNSNTPTQLSFGVAESGNSTRMRVIVWARSFFGPGVEVVRSNPDQPSPGPKYSMSQAGSNGSVWVPVLNREYTTTDQTGIGSVTFTADEIVAAYSHYKTATGVFSSSSFPFAGDAGVQWDTYISVTCQNESESSTPSHAVIGRGGITQLPYLSFGPFNQSTVRVPNSANSANDVLDSYEDLDVSRGWDSYIMPNETT